MERIPQPKARLVINVMEHGTIVGTDDPVEMDFEDCVNAVSGLIEWLADLVAEVHDGPRRQMGAAVLIEALHRWTFVESEEEDDEQDDLPDEDDDTVN